MRKIIIFPALTMLLTIFTVSGFCFDRMALGNAPSKMYKELLDDLDNKRFSKITDFFPQPISDISAEIQKKLSFDLKTDIIQKARVSDSQGVKLSVSKLVYYDTKNIFRYIEMNQTDDVSVLNDWIKAAYSNYIVLSPEIQAKDMAADWKLRKMFTMIFTKLSSSGYTDKNVQLDTETKTAIKDLSGKIQAALASSFPEYQ